MKPLTPTDFDLKHAMKTPLIPGAQLPSPQYRNLSRVAHVLPPTSPAQRSRQLYSQRKKFFTPHLYPARLMLIARRPGVNFADAKLTPCGRNDRKLLKKLKNLF
jgi:hypothetical protein